MIGPFRLQVVSVALEQRYTSRVGDDDSVKYRCELQSPDGTLRMTLTTTEPLSLNGTFTLEQSETP